MNTAPYVHRFEAKHGPGEETHLQFKTTRLVCQRDGVSQVKRKYQKAAKFTVPVWKYLFEPTAEKAKIYWSSMQSIQYYSIGCTMRRNYSCITKQEHKQTARRPWACTKSCSAELEGLIHTKSTTINQEKVFYVQKEQSKNDNTSKSRPNSRAVWCLKSLYKYWIWLLGLFHCEDLAKKRKAMVFSVYFLTLRAVHIEVVPNLDTYSFLKAFIQFIPRRGRPSTMISNNCTNYREAEWKFAV